MNIHPRVRSLPKCALWVLLLGLAGASPAGTFDGDAPPLNPCPLPGRACLPLLAAAAPLSSSSTNGTAQIQAARPASRERATAGVLATTGLIVLTVLLTASGLALLRSFKSR